MPLLFCYGTLQQPDVQLSTFGRLLDGHADELIDFEQGLFEVEDPEFVARSDKAFHAIVKYNGRNDSRVRSARRAIQSRGSSAAMGSVSHC